MHWWKKKREFPPFWTIKSPVLVPSSPQCWADGIKSPWGSGGGAGTAWEPTAAGGVPLGRLKTVIDPSLRRHNRPIQRSCSLGGRREAEGAARDGLRFPPLFLCAKKKLDQIAVWDNATKPKPRRPRTVATLAPPGQNAAVSTGVGKVEPQDNPDARRGGVKKHPVL